MGKISPTIRTRGHAETPFIVGFFSLMSGLVWATVLCHKHAEYALWQKVGVFVASPVVGLLAFILFVSIMLLMGSIGERLDGLLSRRRKSRTKLDG